MPLLGADAGYANTPIWFLLALLEIIIINHMSYNYIPTRLRTLTILLISVLGYYMSCIGNPYYIGSAMLCSIFFYVGKEKREYFLKRQKGIYYWLAFAASLIIYIIFIGYTNVSANFIPVGYLPFFAISILATFSIVGSSRWINNKAQKLSDILSWLGENSLAIMLTHMFFITIQNKIIMISLPIMLTMCISLIIVMLVDVAFVMLINKYAKFLLGK